MAIDQLVGAVGPSAGCANDVYNRGVAKDIFECRLDRFWRIVLRLADDAILDLVYVAAHDEALDHGVRLRDTSMLYSLRGPLERPAQHLDAPREAEPLSSGPADDELASFIVDSSSGSVGPQCETVPAQPPDERPASHAEMRLRLAWFLMGADEAMDYTAATHADIEALAGS